MTTPSLRGHTALVTGGSRDNLLKIVMRGDQEKSAASAHPPGQPNNNTGTATTGSNMNSSQADYNASLKDGSAPSGSQPAPGGKN
jgi:hypothetical protein